VMVGAVMVAVLGMIAAHRSARTTAPVT